MRHKSILTIMAMSSVLLLSACGPVPVPIPPADTTAPTLAEVTPVPYGSDTTPSYTFSSNEAGTITYGGSCSSATTAGSSGNNIITLSALAVGYYKNCTVTVTDAAGNASTALALTPFTVGKPYNDTGITKCGDMAYNYTGYYGSGAHNNNVDCINGASPSSTASQEGFEIANGNDSVPAGQDAHFGRDADAAKNSDADGHNGFSFTKLSAVDGSVLAIQNGSWSDVGSEAAGTQWGCVQDNVTGLVWEVKTNDGGLRYKDWTYSWYNTDSSNNGGDAGYADYANNCYTTTRCDTEKFVADVNAVSLCGKTGWRMPTAFELKTLRNLDTYAPAIDRNFIPNTQSSYYWTILPSDNSAYARYVTFDYGSEGSAYKYRNYYVRLVHGGQ